MNSLTDLGRACRNLAGGDTFSGCWATAGVVLDTGTMRVSAQGTDYSIWKMGALDDSEVSTDFSICKGTRKDGMACTMATSKYVLLTH